MRLISLAFIVFIVFSCKKDKPEISEVEEVLDNGMIVLCEGLFQHNNASISWIDFDNGTVSNDLFVSKTGRQLGDTGNDMKQYGGKIYIIVNVSSTIEVMDATTFKPISQISMVASGSSKQPRSLAFHNGKVYVSCYDGYVDVIDTSSLTITQRIQVGSNPEGLSIANNKLYVANSGGLNFPVPDSTISVIDLSTHTEIKKITVGMNPGGVITDSQGGVYAVIRGDYAVVPSRMVRIDTQNDVLAETFPFDVSGMYPMNDQLLISFYNYSTETSTIGLFDPFTETLVSSNYISTSGITTLYGMKYNPSKNTIFILDGMNYTNTGYVREYSVSGVQLANYHVGLNPTKIIFK
jgi:YVTN family beta-propeller protein